MLFLFFIILSCVDVKYIKIGEYETYQKISNTNTVYKDNNKNNNELNNNELNTIDPDIKKEALELTKDVTEMFLEQK